MRCYFLIELVNPEIQVFRNMFIYLPSSHLSIHLFTHMINILSVLILCNVQCNCKDETAFEVSQSPEEDIHIAIIDAGILFFFF